MSVWKVWDTLLFAPFNGSVSVSSSCLCSVGLCDTVCQLSLQLKTKCWQFCTRKDESGSKRFLHWLWRSASTQWQNPDIVAWLPGSTLHSYFVYQAVMTAVLWHRFGCRFKSCRVFKDSRQTHSASVRWTAPLVTVCFAHKPIWCKHYIVSCHNLMLNCWDSVVFSDKNCTIQWALLIYHWWLCAICFQKSTC